MNTEQRELLARQRTVHGWVFEDLPAGKIKAIKDFLDGGPCPERYRKVYQLCRQQLKLDPEPEPATSPALLPLMCFRCLLTICRHNHCSGTIPAVTSYKGTSYCHDCAEQAELEAEDSP